MCPLVLATQLRFIHTLHQSYSPLSSTTCLPPVWSRSSVGATDDQIRRSWIRSPPRSKLFSRSASCGLPSLLKKLSAVQLFTFTHTAHTSLLNLPRYARKIYATVEIHNRNSMGSFSSFTLTYTTGLSL